MSCTTKHKITNHWIDCIEGSAYDSDYQILHGFPVLLSLTVNITVE